MHELSICRSIADIVSRHAAGRSVSTVRVRIGQLRQVVPETLVYCWSLVSEDTPLDGSRLEVESVPAAIRCRGCDHRRVLDAPILACDACGSRDVEIVSGEEFLVTSLDLAEAENGAR